MDVKSLCGRWFGMKVFNKVTVDQFHKKSEGVAGEVA